MSAVSDRVFQDGDFRMEGVGERRGVKGWGVGAKG